MTLEAKVGILKDRISIGSSEYTLGRDGRWITLPAMGAFPGGRVRYDALHDRIRIESRGGLLEIRFRWRNTVFAWRGQEYLVGPLAWGHVMVSRGERPVATGRVTLTGVRLGYVAPELEPIAPPLAIGLAYRAVTFWLAAGTAGRAH